MSEIHPAPSVFAPDKVAADPILHFFHYAHLPEKLQASSKPFCDLAAHIVATLPRNAERSVALRKLLEAKDAAVRANVGPVQQTLVSGTTGRKSDAQLLKEQWDAKLIEGDDTIVNEITDFDIDRDGPIEFD